jgi:hypothetical protein
MLLCYIREAVLFRILRSILSESVYHIVLNEAHRALLY